LKNLKSTKKKLNNEVFGDIITNAHIAKTKVYRTKKLLDFTYSDELQASGFWTLIIIIYSSKSQMQLRLRVLYLT